MELIKRISTAILLALLIALPLAFIEALMIYCIISIYEIPYFVNFEYYQILGLSFIYMMTRNRIKMRDENITNKDFIKERTNSKNSSLFVNSKFDISQHWLERLHQYYAFQSFYSISKDYPAATGKLFRFPCS